MSALVVVLSACAPHQDGSLGPETAGAAEQALAPLGSAHIGFIGIDGTEQKSRDISHIYKMRTCWRGGPAAYFDGPNNALANVQADSWKIAWGAQANACAWVKKGLRKIVVSGFSRGAVIATEVANRLMRGMCGASVQIRGAVLIDAVDTAMNSSQVSFSKSFDRHVPGLHVIKPQDIQSPGFFTLQVGKIDRITYSKSFSIDQKLSSSLHGGMGYDTDLLYNFIYSRNQGLPLGSWDACFRPQMGDALRCTSRRNLAACLTGGGGARCLDRECSLPSGQGEEVCRALQNHERDPKSKGPPLSDGFFKLTDCIEKKGGGTCVAKAEGRCAAR